MSASVVFGLTSALGYGITDYLARSAARTVGVWRSLFYGDLLVFAALSAWLLGTGGGQHFAFGAGVLAWTASIAAGVILLAAAAFLTRGLMHGSLAVVAPVAASYGAISAALSVAAGERLPRHAVLGIAVTVLGVIGVSFPEGGRREFKRHLGSSGFGWAAGAAAGYGVGFWLQGKYAVPALGAVIPVWVSYGIVVLLLPLLRAPLGTSLALPSAAQLKPVIGAGLFSGVAYASLTLGLATGRISIVVVLSTLASAVTVMLARLIDGAHVARHQWLAIGVIVGGLSLIQS